MDAGYVYVQGSSVVTGLKTPKSREDVLLDEVKIVELLKLRAKLSSNGKELLRIYWYDGAPSIGPSVGQIRIGKLDDVKLRLGQLNSEGQQKGVDSLIVTDLMELARNRAIGDAVVVTGDEDIRVGVQIAQSLGVRVHLLGISGPKSSQSLSLLQEADTVMVWGKPEVSTFLKIQGAKEVSEPKKVVSKKSAVAVVKSLPAKIDAGFISGVVQSTFDHLKLDNHKFERAIKTVSQGKDLPGPIVAVLKAELFKLYSRNPTKLENKTARDELSKKLREVR